MLTRSRMQLDSMPAATTAVPQPIRPIRPFKRAGVNHNNNPNNSMATVAERRAAYNRHTGVLLSLEAELLHAFREAEASGAVVDVAGQAPWRPEDWSDRALPTTCCRVARRFGAVQHGIPALLTRTIMTLCALLATCSGVSLCCSLAVRAASS